MRNLDSSWKRSRRLHFSLSETGKELKKRDYAPGQHGQDKKKLSEYGRQLQEKQKLRNLYGVNEKQFVRLFKIARKSETVTGTEFMIILESRLDNLVYRMGFASTRAQARQLVNHGHILVNGKKIDIPSYICKPGDKISLKEKSKDLKIVKASLEALAVAPKYVTIDKEKKEGSFDRLPERSELSQEINESLIVEFYNRKL